MEIEDKQMPVMMQSEGLKLTKTSRGYSWEIKILEIDVDRLVKINEEMLEEFGKVGLD